MLYRLKDLMAMTVRGTDGDAGDVHDVYLERADWRVRYLVVSTGPWLFGRKVLIAPQVAGEPLWEDKVLPVDLTRDQVRESPDVDLERPVSRQQLDDLNAYYGWPAYWMGGPVAGTTPAQGYPVAIAPLSARPPEGREPEPFEGAQERVNPDLHSAREVLGYALECSDGKAGTVDDLILDENWAIPYLVIDTSALLPGKRVLVATPSVRDVVLNGRMVTVDMTVDTVRNSPEYDPGAPIDRSYERRLNEYYGEPGRRMREPEGRRR